MTTLADMDGNETFEASAVGHAEEVNQEHSSELSRIALVCWGSASSSWVFSSYASCRTLHRVCLRRDVPARQCLPQIGCL